MYADSYMTKAEFRQMFDHTLYDEMRQKYQCINAFPDVYDKVNKAARAGSSSSATTTKWRRWKGHSFSLRAEACINTTTYIHL